jgi:hypothetical protein
MDAEECINSHAVTSCRYFCSTEQLHFSQGIDNMSSLSGCFNINQPVTNRYFVSSPTIPVPRATELLMALSQLILTICL